jgi:ribosomal protein L11 methyltransferase
MDHIEVDCRVSPSGENTEILVALLSEIGFTMFEEDETGVKAYIESRNFDNALLDNVLNDFPVPGVSVSAVITTIPYTNWNAQWERNFQPVRVGEEVNVRAEYHQPDPDVRFDLVIQPRMAFGTGHHATTWLMMKTMLGMSFEGLPVLDMGSGTGILGILALKMGAGSVLGIDHDPNATENALDNAVANGVPEAVFVTGDASVLGRDEYKVILANINRNIILNDLPLYINAGQTGCKYLFSGFYLEDLDLIREKAESLGLQYQSHESLENWVCALFIKK